MKLYVDGVDVTGAVANRTMADNALPFAIGQSSSSAYFNGAIDEVARYNVALSSAALQAHYQAGPQGLSDIVAPSLSGAAQDRRR